MKLYKILEHITSVAVAFLLVTATALWTGSLWGNSFGTDIPPHSSHTAATKSSDETPTPDILQALNLQPDETKLTSRDSVSWILSAADGQQLGTIIASQRLATEVRGFAGATPVYVFINTQGVVTAIAAGDNAETPDFFRRASDNILHLWNGRTAQEAQNLEVDAVSGATFSSRALIANVQAALASYNASQQTASAAPVIGWGKTAAVIAVLILGIIASVWLKGRKWVRITILLLNVGVTGFWCGQFLSLSMLRGWSANGVELIASLPAVLLLAVAVLMPFFGRKHHYCSWVCPYGSLQELFGRLPTPKPHLSAKAYRTMRHVRFGIFSVLMLLLWSGTASYILDYEPFTAFLVTTAMPAVVVLATAFVVACIFVPNLWCKTCCPMGELLSLAEDDHFTPKQTRKK